MDKSQAIPIIFNLTSEVYYFNDQPALVIVTRYMSKLDIISVGLCELWSYLFIQDRCFATSVT